MASSGQSDKIIDMKNLIFVLFFALVSCSLLAPQKDSSRVRRTKVPFGAKTDTELRKRILVLPFKDKNIGRSEEVKKQARDYFISQIQRTGKVVVVHLNDLPQDIESYYKNGAYDLVAIANMARPLDIAVIVEGNILELQAKKMGDQVGVFRNVRAKMDATTHIKAVSAKNNMTLVDQTRQATAETIVRVVGKEDMNQRALQEDPGLIRASVAKSLQESIVPILRVVDKISWSGHVALVKGDRIYVNAGKISGIQLGDILRVSEKGEEIFDPETGRLIGMAPGRTKGTIEVIHYFGKDGTVAIIHSGGGFSENDQVELYY